MLAILGAAVDGQVAARRPLNLFARAGDIVTNTAVLGSTPGLAGISIIVVHMSSLWCQEVQSSIMHNNPTKFLK